MIYLQKYIYIYIWCVFFIQGMWKFRRSDNNKLRILNDDWEQVFKHDMLELWTKALRRKNHIMFPVRKSPLDCDWEVYQRLFEVPFYAKSKSWVSCLTFLRVCSFCSFQAFQAHELMSFLISTCSNHPLHALHGCKGAQLFTWCFGIECHCERNGTRTDQKPGTPWDSLGLPGTGLIRASRQVHCFSENATAWYMDED